MRNCKPFVQTNGLQLRKNKTNVLRDKTNGLQRNPFGQTNGLREKTGDLVLKISSDWRGSIHALEVHTNILFFKQKWFHRVRERYKICSRGFTDM